MEDKLRYLTLITAITATLGSLYLSLGLGLYPCKYCWYQRILMYPLVPIIAYSIIRNTYPHELIWFFTSIGLLISAYHSYIQVQPTGSFCTTMCTATVFTVGPFTIPNLSFIAFFIITMSSVIHYYTSRKN